MKKKNKKSKKMSWDFECRRFLVKYDESSMILTKKMTQIAEKRVFFLAFLTFLKIDFQMTRFFSGTGPKKLKMSRTAKSNFAIKRQPQRFFQFLQRKKMKKKSDFLKNWILQKNRCANFKSLTPILNPLFFDESSKSYFWKSLRFSASTNFF